MQASKAETSRSDAMSKTLDSCFHDERPSINVDFLDICYPVHSGSVNGRKQILQGLSGSFKFGELTAILGSSGAGKSTLLNILTGYVSVNVGGSIKINGNPCHLDIFKKLSRYIMQDDLVQSYLTVEESMIIAADLKLSRELSRDKKAEMIKQILETLGLEKHRLTRTENLSGGQKKRLSIALELLNDPPVVFLDEPTTGLDIVASVQVVQMLQKLARQGRTVICTLHQPTAFICQYIDHLYVMTHGHCIYQGSFQKLVPFMSHIGYDCPKTHNPADYIIEIIQGRSKAEIKTMSQVVENGKLSIEAAENEDNVTEFKKVFRQQKLRGTLDYSYRQRHRCPYSQQCCVLLKRKFKQQSRNLLEMGILIFHHILTALLLGTIFLGVGQDGARPYENFKFLISVVVFFMYTHVMIPLLLFPIEMKLMKREYFNGWYSLKAYFTALCLVNLPCQIIFGFVFIIISYVISGQPLDMWRMMYFTAIGLLLAYTSEGWGLTVGSLCSSRNGSILGPASVVPLLAVGVYGMGFGSEVQAPMRFLMSLSYLRYGIVGLTTSVYWQNRTIICSEEEIYCHYKDPRLLLKDLGMEGSTPIGQITGLVIFLVLYRMTAYLGMRYRLSTELSSRLLNLVSKLFRFRQKHK